MQPRYQKSASARCVSTNFGIWPFGAWYAASVARPFAAASSSPGPPDTAIPNAHTAASRPKIAPYPRAWERAVGVAAMIPSGVRLRSSSRTDSARQVATSASSSGARSGERIGAEESTRTASSSLSLDYALRPASSGAAHRRRAAPPGNRRAHGRAAGDDRRSEVVSPVSTFVNASTSPSGARSTAVSSHTSSPRGRLSGLAEELKEEPADDDQQHTFAARVVRTRRRASTSRPRRRSGVSRRSRTAPGRAGATRGRAR